MFRTIQAHFKGGWGFCCPASNIIQENFPLVNRKFGIFSFFCMVFFMVEKIKNLAKSNNINITNLESKLGFSQGSLRKWDDSIPSIDKVAQVADFFGVSLDYLYGRAEEKKTADVISDLSPREVSLILALRQLPDAGWIAAEKLIEAFEFVPGVQSESHEDG